jgi:hypothetical protein
MVDYLVGARAGQRLTVRLQTPGRFTYVVVRAPGSGDNLYDATSAERTTTLTLPASGERRLSHPRVPDAECGAARRDVELQSDDPRRRVS